MALPQPRSEADAQAAVKQLNRSFFDTSKISPLFATDAGVTGHLRPVIFGLALFVASWFIQAQFDALGLEGHCVLHQNYV